MCLYNVGITFWLKQVSLNQSASFLSRAGAVNKGLDVLSICSPVVYTQWGCKEK